MERDPKVSQDGITKQSCDDVDIPVWMIPFLNKYKTEICAEVTARVAYSVRLMLDKQLVEIQSLILQQGDKFEGVVKEAIRKELEAKEPKDQHEEGQKKEREQQAVTTKSEASTTWTFLRQDGIVKSSTAEAQEKPAENVEREREKEEKKKRKRKRKLKLKELTPKCDSVTEVSTPVKVIDDEGERVEEAMQKTEDVSPISKSNETTLETLTEPTSEPVNRTAAELQKTEKEPVVTEAKATGSVPQLQLQSRNENNTSQLVPDTIEGPAVETDVLPSLIVCDEPQETRVRSASSSSGSEFEVVLMPVPVSSSQHSYSSTETYVLPPGSDEDTDSDYVNIHKEQLDDAESLQFSCPEDNAGTRMDNDAPEPEETAKNIAKATEQTAALEETGPSPSVPEAKPTGNTPPSIGQHDGKDEASGGEATEVELEESASPKSPREKVFTKDFFQQVDAFEKKTQVHKSPKDSVAFVEPAQDGRLLSPTRVQHPPLKSIPLQADARSSRGGALEEALLNIPYESSHTVGKDQDPIPQDPTPAPHRYSVDVPSETLWEGALTRAAQAYNTARTAVDDISDTFSQVRQCSKAIAIRTVRSETLRKEQCLSQLEEMGFHNRLLNIKLLERHKYDLEIVITALVELQSGW